MKAEAKDLFVRAHELEGEEREAFLAEACGDDIELRLEVQRLLVQARKADSFFENDEGATIGAADFVDSTHAEAEGDLIGPYKLRQQIGQGGFGTVWMAEQSVPISRMVALKVIKAGMDTKQVLARFEAERQALAMMDHPNIARVLDAGATASGRPYFAMELVKGIPITRFCDEQGLGTQEMLALFGDVCSAINHAHQKGIIHRDIKPSNVMVTLHGDKPVVKVIDFGIAKATQGKLTDQTLFTRFEQFIGTPVYMSPEQASLSGLDIDTRSDIYALGILLYELLVGKPPFDAKSLVSAGYEEMRRIIREVEPVKPSSRLATVAGEERTALAKTRRIDEAKLSRLVEPDLDWIVMKAIEKDRTRRYETANAFAQDIARFVADEPVTATPPSAAYRMKKFVRRNRRGLLSGAAAAAALLAGLAVAGGVWLDSTFEKNERVSRAAGLIGQAEGRMEQNAAVDFDDDRPFREARELARRAEESLSGIKLPDARMRERRERLQEELAREERDRTLVAGIEEAMMTGTSGLATKGTTVPTMANDFAAAFAAAGIEPLDRPMEDTVERIRAGRGGLQDRILAGLAKWSESLEATDPEMAARLEEIIDRADADPWRRELRQAIRDGNAAALEALAGRDEIAGQPTMTVLQLSSALGEKQLAGALEKLLRRAQQEAPADFWTNFSLGNALAGAFDRKEGEDIRRQVMYAGGAHHGGGLPGLAPDLNPLRPEFDESIGYLRAAVAARPDTAMAWMVLGLALSSGGYLDEALVIYRHAAARFPETEGLDLLLGYSLHCQDRPEEALPYLRRAAEREPAIGMLQYTLGATMAQLGDYEEARAALLRAVELELQTAGEPGEQAGDPAKGQNFTQVLWMGKPARLNEEIAHLYLAAIQHGRGDSEEALASVKLALDLNPDHAEAHLVRGTVLMNTGRFAESKRSVEKALELDPELAAAHNILGALLMGAGDHAGAIPSIRRSIELDPKDASAHANLGACMAKLGKFGEALSSLETALELAPGYPLAWNHLGSVFKDQDQPEKAIESFRKAISFDPGKTTTARPNLVKVLWKTGRPEEALAACREFNDAKAYVQLADLLAEARKIEEAIEALEQAVALRPDDAVAHHDLGSLYLGMGRYKDAVTSFRHAVRLAPWMASAHNQLAFLLMLQGDCEESVESIMKALQLEPDSKTFKSTLMSVLLSSGRIPAAVLLHGPCTNPQFAMDSMVGKDAELREILERDGPGSAEVERLLADLSERFSFLNTEATKHLPPNPEELQAVWNDRRDEVASHLGSATVRLIQIRKQSDKRPGATREKVRAFAEEILKKLAEGGDFAELAEAHSEGWADGKAQTEAYGELPAALNAAAFALKDGDFTRSLIEDEHAFYLLKVESRQSGKAEDFDDPKVREAIKGLIELQRRGDWEKRYLARIQDSVPDLVTARVRRMAGRELHAAGEFARAAGLFEQALAVQVEKLGAENPESLVTKHDLASSYSEAGRWDEALAMQEEVLALRRKVSGPEQPETLTAINNLAGSYFKAGRRDEALKMQEVVVALRRKLSGPENPETLTAINNLALYYFQAGRQDEALKLQQEVLAVRQKASGKEHPNTLTAMNNLAGSYIRAGRLDEGLMLLEEVVPGSREVKGPEHPDTLQAVNNLATAYHEAGRRDEAIKLLEESLPLRRKVSGPQHPDTLKALRNLALFYGEAGRVEDLKRLKEEYGVMPLDELAAEGRREALNRLKDEYGAMQRQPGAPPSSGSKPMPPAPAGSDATGGRGDEPQGSGAEDLTACDFVIQISMSLLMQEKIAEAGKFSEEALAIVRGMQDENGEVLGRLLVLRGTILAKQYKYQEAEEAAREGLALLKAHHGQNHWQVADALAGLGGVLEEQGNYAAAEDAARQAVEMMIQLKGSEDQTTLSNLANLARILDSGRKFKEAEETYLKVLATKEKLLGPNHPEVSTILSDLTRSLSAQDKFVEAEKVIRRSLEIQKATMGAEHPSSQFILAKVLRDQGRFDEADPMFQQILEAVKKMFGPEHPNMAKVLLGYASSLEKQKKFAEAKPLAESALAIQEAVLSEQHPDFAETFEVLGRIHAGLGNESEAQEFQAKKARVEEANAERGEAAARRDETAEPKEKTPEPPHDANAPNVATKALRSAALEAWSGKDAGHEDTLRKMLAWAAATESPDVAERMAKLVCLRPIRDAKVQEATLALAGKGVELRKESGQPAPWQQMVLGMARYRGGHYQEAETVLGAVTKMIEPETYRPGIIRGTANFYRAMSLFQLGRKDEARALFTATEAKMRPFPADEKHPLADKADHDDLILWLACREAKALLAESEANR